jgi:hypothetical protein
MTLHAVVWRANAKVPARDQGTMLRVAVSRIVVSKPALARLMTLLVAAFLQFASIPARVQVMMRLAAVLPPIAYRHF